VALQDTVRSYTEQIINEARPEQRQGRIPKGGVEHMDRLQVQLFTFEPTRTPRRDHAQAHNA
jgi:hypothetical protein